MSRDERRRTILKAAEDLFLSRRFDQVTLEDVRKKARVGKGTIYGYFRDKEDLYAQVVLSGLDELHGSLQQELSGPSTADDKLVATAQALESFYRRHGSLFRSLHGVESRRAFKGRGLHRELMEGRTRIAALVASVLQAGAEDGTYRSDVPSLSAARVFLAITREAMRGHDVDGGPPLAPDQVVALFLDGIRKR
jgi:AcrR family transcriptional regulator